MSNNDDKKEEIQEKSLDRRLDRRQERRTHRIETVIPKDRFTKTSDFVQAVLTGELIAERITGAGPITRREQTREPRLFDDKFGLLDRPPRERIIEPRITPTAGVERGQTKITDNTDFTINDYHLVVDSNNRGVCSEIALRSPSSNFSLSIIIDDIKQFDRTYTEFAVLSPQSELIDAFVETHGDELYVLHIGELSWRKSCQAIVRVTESIIFDNIFVNMKEFRI